MKDMASIDYIISRGGRLWDNFKNLPEVYHYYMPRHIHAAVKFCYDMAKTNPNFRDLTLYQLMFGNKQHAAVLYFTEFVASRIEYCRLTAIGGGSGGRSNHHLQFRLVVATYSKWVRFYMVGPC